MSTLNKLFRNKNKLYFTKKKLYEYPGGNQVDGSPPVSSRQIPLYGFRKSHFFKISEHFLNFQNQLKNLF